MNYPKMIHRALTLIVRDKKTNTLNRHHAVQAISLATGLTERKIMKWMSVLEANGLVAVSMQDIKLVKKAEDA